MQGEIVQINFKRGLVAVRTETEGISIFEMLSDDNFDIGNVINWSENKPLGDCQVKNITNGKIQEVYFQNHWVSEKDLAKQLK